MSVVNGETKTDAGIWSACLESNTIQSIYLGDREYRIDYRFRGGYSLIRKKNREEFDFFALIGNIGRL